MTMPNWPNTVPSAPMLMSLLPALKTTPSVPAAVAAIPLLISTELAPAPEMAGEPDPREIIPPVASTCSVSPSASVTAGVLLAVTTLGVEIVTTVMAIPPSGIDSPAPETKMIHVARFYPRSHQQRGHA